METKRETAQAVRATRAEVENPGGPSTNDIIAGLRELRAMIRVIELLRDFSLDWGKNGQPTTH